MQNTYIGTPRGKLPIAISKSFSLFYLRTVANHTQNIARILPQIPLFLQAIFFYYNYIQSRFASLQLKSNN